MTNTSRSSYVESENQDNSFPRFPRAFMSVSREELSHVSLTIKDAAGNDAALPLDLQGHVFINSFAGTAASPPPDDQPAGAIPEATVMPAASGITALFDGDGMVFRLDFHQAPGQSRKTGKGLLTSRLIKPPAFFADKITQENPKYKDFEFLDMGISRVSILGACNQLNTALVKVLVSQTSPPRLLVTNDAARPYEIDPCSLKIIAPVGDLRPPKNQQNTETQEIWSALDVFPGIFELLMSSAHPCTSFSAEADQEEAELFTVSDDKTPLHLLLHRNPDDRSTSDKLSLIRWKILSGEEESFQQWEVIYQGKPAQILQSTHMLGMTENYIIIADTAMKFEQIETVFLMSVGFVNSLLIILSSTGEEREIEVDRLESTLKLILKLVQLNTNELKKSIWKAVVVTFRTLASAFRKLPVRQKLSLITTLSAENSSSPRLFRTVEMKTQLGRNILQEFEMLSEELENVNSTSLQEDVTESFHLSTQSSTRGLITNLKSDDNKTLELLERQLESVENISDSAILKMFFKACDWIKDSAAILERELVDELVKQLKLKVASRQNPNTPLYIVRRSDLESPEAISQQKVNAQRVEVQGAFAHLFTDYSETENGEITIVAPMTDAMDPAEYINRYDRSQVIEGENIDDLAGAIPLGLDSNELALITIDPQRDNGGSVSPHRLTFDKVKQTDEYQNREIYSNFRENPLYMGLYAYRDDNPRLTDIFVMQGGAYPDIMTEFIYDLYKDYSSNRKVSLDKLMSAVTDGTPMFLTHTKVDRDNPESYLKVVQTYEFSKGEVVYSLQFVPRAGGDERSGEDGYLICTVVKSDNLYSNSRQSEDPNWSDNSEIWIFDAGSLAQGPKYRLSHPRLNFGLTLHSTWLDKIEPAANRAYSFDQDYKPWVKKFIRNYLDVSKRKSQDEELLNSLFKEIGQEFDQYRKQF